MDVDAAAQIGRVAGDAAARHGERICVGVDAAAIIYGGIAFDAAA